MSTRNSKEEMSALYAKRDAEANRIANENYNKALSGKSDGGCFPAGTVVLTKHGGRTIERINVGDSIVTIDPISGARINCEVLKLLKHKSRRILAIDFTDGSSLNTTKYHSFRSDQKWTIAKNLAAGNRVQVYDCKYGMLEKVVTSTRYTGEVKDVYNLVTQGQHSFLAEGALVHNFTYFRRTRVFYWEILKLFQKNFKRVVGYLQCPRYGYLKPALNFHQLVLTTWHWKQ